MHPGVAEGQPPGWLGSLDDLVLLYRTALDALGLRRVDVAGYGLGGWLAALVALWCPERVGRLVLVAPFGLRVPGAPLADFLAASPARLEELLLGDGPPVPGLLADPGDPAAFARQYGELGVTARLMWERRYDLRLERRLPLVAAPTLVLRPGDDRLVPAAHADRWAALLPDARVRDLPGLGHAAPVQDPDAVAGAITSFLER